MSKRRASAAAAALLLWAAAHARAGELRAGFGAAPLPAEAGEPMGGYGGLTTRRAEGVLYPPEARALVLDQGPLRVAIASLDVVIARPSLRELALAEAAPLGIDVFTLVATHTHSGPGGYLPGWVQARLTAGEYDPNMPGRLAHAVAEALQRAVDDLAPATLASRNAPLALARNRRYADGAADTELALLRADFADGREPIVLFGYGAHATLLSPGNHRLSADWPGAARAALAARGFRAIFVPGPLGYQEPAIDSSMWGGDEEEREVTAQFGAEMADAVASAARSAAPGSDPPLLDARERWVDTPAAQLRPFCALWWLSPLLGSTLDEFVAKRVPFQAIRAGNAELATVPAEPAAAVGAALRQHFPPGRTRFVVAHANDWLGYVVDEPTYERGGYEACLDLLGPHGAGWLVARAAESVAALDSPAGAAP